MADDESGVIDLVPKASATVVSGVNNIRVFVGLYVHSVSKEEPLRIVSKGVIGVSHGKILFVDVEEKMEQLKRKHGFEGDSVTVLGPSEFLMPGLIDAHIHASQYANSGLGLDLPLLEWLETYTYPMESKFKDLQFAGSVYKKVVERTLRNGTTTASYFCTIHRKATEVMADVVEEMGQRAFIGKVCMDSYSPEYYVETTEKSLRSTEKFVVNMLKRHSSRVQPTITPRFALACSDSLMRGLSNIAKKYDTRIQTHLCETEAEIARAVELFPQYKTYTGIYEGTGLLTNKSIMAHCVHMHRKEIETLARHSSGVAHCPLSNLCIRSGFCPVRKLIHAGIGVGLGTDVSGGYSSSILEAMRQALLTSNAIAIRDKNYKPLDYKEIFYLGTLGGAQALAIEKHVGNFEVGKYFDALHVRLNSVGSAIDSFPRETHSQMVQKFIMLGDDRNIVHVFVEGREIRFQA